MNIIQYGIEKLKIFNKRGLKLMNIKDKDLHMDKLPLVREDFRVVYCHKMSVLFTNILFTFVCDINQFD